MSAIVSGVLKLTVGVLANKARSSLAAHLKDGDITDEQCRNLIVKELDDIKGKLDGLSRKDLLSSLSFLREGITVLSKFLLELESNENTAESSERVTLVESASSRDTGPDSAINEAIALINAVSSLKIHSNDRFKSAIESFKLAREKATEAFNNEALSIKDRIRASQIRMMARILEKLEDPETSVCTCLQYLKELHDVDTVKGIFSVLIDGGTFKSQINKKKRLENASSVHLMNQVLFDFARKFTKSPPRILDWPTITFGTKSYHPMFGESGFFRKLEEAGVHVMPLNPDFTFDDKVFSVDSVVNSKGQIVAQAQGEGTLKIFKRSGESRTLREAPREEHASECYVEAMDIDAKDNLYVITTFRESDDESRSFKLFIFDENGNKKHECPLPFHYRSPTEKVCMAINKDGKIAILNREKSFLYIGNVCAKLNSFKVDDCLRLNELSIMRVNFRFSDFNGTKIISADKYAVYICTENGESEQKIKIPEEHGLVESVAINHSTKHILVKTCQSSGPSLLSFSETGELINSLCLGSSEWIRHSKVTSHPNGPVALVDQTGAALLQL
jgi:hypothetical protein